MSDEAAAALAVALHAREEFLGGANGALPGSRALTEETARLWGKALVVDKHTRLWEANPTSNKIYEALGYRQVVDMANLLIA